MTRKAFETFIRKRFGLPCCRYRRDALWGGGKRGEYRIFHVQLAWEVLEETKRLQKGGTP